MSKERISGLGGRALTFGIRSCRPAYEPQQRESEPRESMQCPPEQRGFERRAGRCCSPAIAGAVLLSWSCIALGQVCAPDALVPHAPATVVYRYAGGATQATLIEPSDDGTVRAVDSATHAPLWAFTPPEVTTARTHSGLLTDVRVLRFDANDDGAIDIGSGDKAWLYFGLRRAGAAYYALDITDRARPRVLWRADATSLDGLGEAWSTPTIAKVRIAGATQNGEHFVVIVGGGYAAAAGAGNRIFMLDAATGYLLWDAGAKGAAGSRTTNLALDEMTEPVPAPVTVLDTDGDELADRMYAVDVSGRLWRFDIWNGRARGALVSGGVLADLAAPTRPGASDARRFFNAPDVALIQPKGAAPYYNISIGSGDVATTTTTHHDRFYSIRDRAPFDARSQAEHDRISPILTTDLKDISASLDSTTLSPDSAGWFLDLSALGRPNERIVAESITLNGVVMFTTFQKSAASGPCVVEGSTRIYVVRIDTARIGADLNGDGKLTDADLSTPMPAIAPPAAVRVRMGAGLNDTGTVPPANGGAGPGSGPAASSGPAAGSQAPQCLVGSTVLKTCVNAEALLRTFWQRRGVR